MSVHCHCSKRLNADGTRTCTYTSIRIDLQTANLTVVDVTPTDENYKLVEELT